MALHLAGNGSRENCGCRWTVIRLGTVKGFAWPSCNDMRESFPLSIGHLLDGQKFGHLRLVLFVSNFPSVR